MNVKGARGKPQSQKEKHERKDLFLILLFFVAFIGLVISLLPNFFQRNNPSNELPVALHSVREADYSRDHEFLKNTSFNLRLLRDILIDQGVNDNELNDRLATLTAVLLSPVPTATGTLSAVNTPTPAWTQTSLPTSAFSLTVAPTPIIPPTTIPTKIVVPPHTSIPPVPAFQLTLSLGTHDDNDSSGSITFQDGLTYKIHLSNTGNTTLSNIHVVDVAFGSPVTCPGIALPANTGMLCTTDSPHIVTLAEANAGKVAMSVFASGDHNGKTYSQTTGLNTAVSQNPSVSIVKNLSSFDDNDSSGTITMGDSLWYQFAITNTGNVTVSNLSVTDDSFALPVACPPVSLAPGNSVNCNTTSAHKVTASDVVAGEVSNTATASVNFNTATYTDSDTLIIPLSIQLEKSLASYADNDASGTITLGDDLWYQFQVSNIGPFVLNSIRVIDNTFSIPVSCPFTTLAPSATMTCAADSPHTVTLAEANSGNVQNAATVTGQPGIGPVVRDTSTLDIPIFQNAALTIAKSANPLTFGAPGQVIDYTFIVSNSGDVTITGPITIDDDKATNESCPAGDIDPGSSITCTASYVIMQADLDAGSVTNTAFAAGTGPGGSPVASAPDAVTVVATQSPSIQIVKMMASYGDLDGSNSITLGDELWYRFNVSNSGNVTLNPVSVTDDSFGIQVTCPGTSLAPGAAMLCAASAAHTVTLAEANAGGVNNTATVTGVLNGTPYSASDSVTTLVSQTAAMALTLGADIPTYNVVGQVITYTYSIENSGNVTLAGPFTVTDDRLGVLANCAGGPLDPATTTTCTSTHVVAQADLDAGSLTNTASVSGNSLTSAPDSLTVTALQSPALTLSKSGLPFTYAAVGQTIAYTYTLQNSGNVTLNGPFQVIDDKTGTIDPCGSGPLSPGSTTSCSASYTTTQYDLDFGSLTNTASGQTAFAGSPVASNSDSVTATAIQSPSYTITKTVIGGSANQAGNVLTYEIRLTNTGNVSLVGANASDPLLDPLNGPIESGTTDGVLSVGETWTYSGAYTVTQADIDSNGGGDGDIDNTASATTTFMPVPQTSSIAVPVTQSPSISMTMSGAWNDDGDGIAEVGETISYSFTVTNDGNVTLANIALSDPGISLSGGPLATLAVGASDTTTFSGSYTLTQADIDAGVKDNAATVRGTPPIGTDVTNTASDSVNLPQSPAVQVIKTSTTTEVTAADQVVPYSFAVSNTGNITLTGITVTDPNCNAAPAYQSGDTNTDNALDLSETWTYTCSRTITQVEMDTGGNLSNTGTADSNESLADTDTLDIPVSQSPSISMTKTGAWNDDGDGIAEAGESIDYAFTVTNNGNVTLTGITLSDPGVSLSGGPIATLAVGASDTGTFTGSYTLTQADIDAGTKDNIATVRGTPPLGGDVTNTASDSIALPPNPAIRLVKSLASYDDNDTSWTVTRGDNLWYRFEVTNTGNVTLTGVGVSDDTFAVPVTCPSTTLAPGEAVLCTADAAHTITLTEANAGQVSNTATASGIFDSMSYGDSDALVTTVYPVGSSIVSGQVRDDSNGNGNLSDKDAGLANVKIELDDGACTLGVNCRAALTGANGSFAFNSVADGSYVLVENDLADYVSTADSDPPNDNQVDVIISGGANSTDNIFLDMAKVSLCSAPDPVNGFVTSTSPGDGATGVPLNTTTIRVTFNQPMITSGAESVLLVGKYELKNQGKGSTITIKGVTYDPVTHTAMLDIDTRDPDWQAGALFNLTVKNLRNACGTAQPNVVRAFTTELEISGHVLNSLDNKGIYGVGIELSGAACSGSCGATTTDLNGYFQFLGFAPGAYSLVETDPSGFDSVSDTNPPNDNRIDLMLTTGSNATGNTFVDTPSTCSPPAISATTPSNGSTGVSLSTASLLVTFSQPMITYGAGSVLAIGNFDNNIDNLSLGGDVPIQAISYDPGTYTATLTIDATDPQWQSGSQFRLRVKSGLKNPCGASLGGDLDVLFTTEAYISGQVTNSLDGKGIYGARVELDDSVCTLGSDCDTALTDLNGGFRFSGRAPGSYTLVQTNLPGYSSFSDSVPPNDDRVALTLAAGANSTGHLFSDTPACTGGASFVTSTLPANNETGVSLSITTLSVVFNQPMVTYGGGSVFDIGNFDNNIDNLTLGGDVPILDVSYDPNTYTATLLLDTSDPQWKPGSQFRLRIKNSIKNACNTSPSATVDVFFTTDLLISGQVRHDLDGDGSLTDLDPGLSGVKIELLDGICTPVLTCQTKVTNAGGFFTFDHLPAGNYIVLETDPLGYISTNDSDGVNDNRITIKLVAGASSIGNRFLDMIGP